MAASETTPPQRPHPLPITSIQPGGGWVFQLELTWDKIRRWFIRGLFPKYVEEMQAKRQGSCPNCPHDIIDPRDLKSYRNVCGYSFKPEDDTFRWRDQLGVARAGLAELTLASLLLGPLTLGFLGAAGAAHWLYLIPGLLCGALWAQVIYFFRDPERTIPTESNILVSPADGTITHIDTVAEPDFPGGKAQRISIFLSIFNVHVNRVPLRGRVVGLRYYPGDFLDARATDSTLRNEQLWIDLLEKGPRERQLRVKQIAGLIARRIVCWLKVGEEVERGVRLGMIKFGSRTELLVPVADTLTLLVKVGDTVRGGSTILARYS